MSTNYTINTFKSGKERDNSKKKFPHNNDTRN